MSTTLTPAAARISIGTIENSDLLRIKSAAWLEAYRSLDSLGRCHRFPSWLFSIVTEEYNRRVACDRGEHSPMAAIVVPIIPRAELAKALIDVRSFTRVRSLPESLRQLFHEIENHIFAQLTEELK